MIADDSGDPNISFFDFGLGTMVNGIIKSPQWQWEKLANSIT